jgi:putative methionine-R-sulfoxide reductase with GAF domain
MSSRALDALDGILDSGGDVDDVLRAAVDVLAAEPGIDWVGIRFLEEGELVLGPASGTPDESRRIATPISYQGDTVGELVVDGDAGRAFLDRVALRMSAHVLLGWDTGGEAWVP